MNIIKRLLPTRRKSRQKKFFQQLIKKDQLCFDIGANVGSKTELFLSIGAQVIAIEPQKQCCDILLKKFKNNNRVTVEKIAVGESNKELELKVSNESQISTFSNEFIRAYSYQAQFNWDGRETVKVKTLDVLIQQYGIPDFCKIDVEGYEFEVFKGLTQNIPLLSFEFNHPLKHLALKCLNRFEAFDSLIYNYVEFENPGFALKKWVKHSDILEIINNLPPEVKTGDIYVKTSK